MDTTEALRRIRLITPMMRKDVETADLSSLVMEAANNTIPKGLEGTFTPFTNIYLAGQNALTKPISAREFSGLRRLVGRQNPEEPRGDPAGVES